jgi:hypothetical protein
MPFDFGQRIKYSNEDDTRHIVKGGSIAETW